MEAAAATALTVFQPPDGSMCSNNDYIALFV